MAESSPRFNIGRALLSTAREADRWLDPHARAAIEEFIRSKADPAGGFSGRHNRTDLYYTFFAMAGLAALGRINPIENLPHYLDNFAAGAELDFVHRCCLARCRTLLPLFGGLPALRLLRENLSFGRRRTRRRLVENIEACRTADGGFSQYGESLPHATLYALFLGWQAGEVLGAGRSWFGQLEAPILGLRSADGGFANRPGERMGTTTATAAAVVMLRALGNDVDDRTIDWLLARSRPEGGFSGNPVAPLPDMLSTASALFALRVLKHPLTKIRPSMLEFVQNHYDRDGGFRGSLADPLTDCEYTFYGLLALGSLA